MQLKGKCLYLHTQTMFVRVLVDCHLLKPNIGWLSFALHQILVDSFVYMEYWLTAICLHRTLVDCHLLTPNIGWLSFPFSRNIGWWSFSLRQILVDCGLLTPNTGWPTFVLPYGILVDHLSRYTHACLLVFRSTPKRSLVTAPLTLWQVVLTLPRRLAKRGNKQTKTKQKPSVATRLYLSTHETR